MNRHIIHGILIFSLSLTVLSGNSHAQSPVDSQIANIIKKWSNKVGQKSTPPTGFKEGGSSYKYYKGSVGEWDVEFTFDESGLFQGVYFSTYEINLTTGPGEHYQRGLNIIQNLYPGLACQTERSSRESGQGNVETPDGLSSDFYSNGKGYVYTTYGATSSATTKCQLPGSSSEVIITGGGDSHSIIRKTGTIGQEGKAYAGIVVQQRR